jgi:hypothetical protein
MTATAAAKNLAREMHSGCYTGRWVLEQGQVSNWINCGGATPHRQNEDHRDLNRRRAGRLQAPLKIGLAVLLELASHHGYAHDRGQFANVNPELKTWFESLKSGKGPCCSDADGTAISDADWQSGNGHYRVRIDGEWVDVPDEAVITEPNRVGRTMVWPIRGYLGLTIRCFMPGSMT